MNGISGASKVVPNFVGGAYLVYTYTNSVKFRIDQVRGDNVVLSGIFFDPAPRMVVMYMSNLGNDV